MSKKHKSGVRFHIEFKTEEQKRAWDAFQKNDVLFLSGCAGVGKTYLAMAFAINEVLQNRKRHIIMTRPIVEAGESLGYLPGDMNEKVNPYMLPLYDCMDKLVGSEGIQREHVEAALEIAPLAYMRGRTFDDSVCIFDEAQNATHMQLKLFLTRLGENSKLIVTGDPSQSDIGSESGFDDVAIRLHSIPGVAVVKFTEVSIARHPIVSAILSRL